MEVTLNGRISLASFLLGLSILAIPLFGLLNGNVANIISFLWQYLIIGHIVTVNTILLFRYRGKGQAYQVAIRGALLGLACGIGIIICSTDKPWRIFGWYMAVLALFHWSEYFVTAVTNPKNLSLSSYILDHSKEYHIAAVASWLEFWLEYFLFPGLKQAPLISYLGLALVIGGEVLRKGAMVTAGTNFNHYIQHVKKEGHQLVTHGLYSYFRHPSYVGWFYWSIGTQVLLCNPICTVLYAAVSWKFFKSRIEDEEITLLNFFGEDYIDYQKKVGTGLPYIKGYRMEL